MPKRFIGTFDQSMLEDIVEFEKRYRDTWLWIKIENADYELYYCNGPFEDGFLFSNQKVGSIKLSAMTTAEIQIHWPVTGLYNYRNGFLYATRVPERQWKRAPCAKNTRFLNVCSSFRGRIGTEQYYDINEEVLSTIITPPTNCTILEAINAMKKTSIYGRVLNNKLAVSLPPFRQAGSYILWYETYPLGYINPKSNSIKIEYEPLKQEIMDYNRDYEKSKWQLI